MRRPSPLALSVLALAAVVLGSALVWSRWGVGLDTLGDTHSGPPPDGPNVLMVVTDDQRVDETTWRVMPHTRRWFIDGGTSFTDAYVTTPLCCPSRATIFTGKMAHNHEIFRTMRQGGERFVHEHTLQYYLRSAGYRTAIFGKYLNGWEIAQNPPYFDRWSIFSEGHPNGYSGATWNVGGEVRPVEEYSTTYVSDQAVGFLEQSELDDDRPWFLYVAPFAPHMPYTPEERYRGAPLPEWEGNPAVFEADRSDKPAYVRGLDRGFDLGSKLRDGQLRTLMSVDDMVGRLFDTLEELEEGRDTLAVFVSDNGYLWGEHGVTRKLVPYTPSIQVPLMVRWPGRVAAGTQDDRLVANVDLAPTVLEAVGIDPDSGHVIDGRSLLGSERRRQLVLEFWRMVHAPDWASIRTPRFQYVEYYEKGGALLDREYYDLVADRWQLRNLLGDRSRRNDPDVQRLSARLARYRACRGVEGPGACP